MPTHMMTSASSCTHFHGVMHYTSDVSDRQEHPGSTFGGKRKEESRELILIIEPLAQARQGAILSKQ